VLRVLDAGGEECWAVEKVVALLRAELADASIKRARRRATCRGTRMTKQPILLSHPEG
jgi:hypothetical protein